MTDNSPLAEMDFAKIEARILAHMDLTPAQYALLASMAKPGTYCIDLPIREDRQPLIDRELIEWVPAPAWSGRHTYTLTEKGRALAKELFHD